MSCTQTESCKSSTISSKPYKSNSTSNVHCLQTTKTQRNAANTNKQKFKKDICSKCENKLDIRVGTNGRYCNNHYIKYCTGKMVKAMSKSNGTDLRENQRAVLAIKSSFKNSVSSLGLLILFNQLQGEVKKFKCKIDEIVCCFDKDDLKQYMSSIKEQNNDAFQNNTDDPDDNQEDPLTDFKDLALENLLKDLKNLANFKISYINCSNLPTTTRITSNKNLINYINDQHVNYILTGYTTTTIAGNILSQVTDGAGEHISLSSLGNEPVQGFSFLKPFRDLSKNDIKNLLGIFVNRDVDNDLISKIHSLKLSTTDPLNKTSTSAVLANELKLFLTDLDEEYPAQIFAVYRIGVKLIGDNRHSEPATAHFTCQNCYRPINFNVDSSATTALNFSRRYDIDGNFTVEDLLSQNFESQFDSSGTYFDEKYCYKCKNSK